MLFNITSDMEHGGEPTFLPQLLQDEDVSYYRGHPHELWSSAECLQSLVSGLSPCRSPHINFVHELTAGASITVRRHNVHRIKFNLGVFNG